MTRQHQEHDIAPMPPKHLAHNPRLGFPILLTCLVATLLAPSYFEQPLMGGLVLSIVLSLLMLSTLYLVAYRLQELLTGIAIAIPVMLTLWWDALLPAPWDVYAVNGLYILFTGYIGLLIGRFLFATNRISLDMILASICLYMLIGLAWAFIYQLIEVGRPGAFNFLDLDEGHMDSVRYMRSQFAYFSYVTLSTLGYGDITPLSRIAQNWAVLEALTGQLYIAVVIARLLGLYINREHSSETQTGKPPGIRD